MLIAQGRFWRAGYARNTGRVSLDLRRASLREELGDLRDVKIEIPLTKWTPVLKHLSSDRKLLGGLLLDFATQKDRVAAVVSNDRLLGELRRVLLDATASLVEEGALVVEPVARGES